MNRREFLKLTGAAAAGGLLSSCNMNPEKLIPLLVPPENGSIPGVFDYYASTCRQCPAGCGIIVRTHEGRANKIEGNPLHPVNKGRICARGQAALQELYHPDRIKQPLQRTGRRGSGKFGPISWEEGFSLLAEKLKGIRRTGAQKEMMLFTPELRGSMLSLVRSFTGLLNGRHIPYETINTESHRKASRSVYGRDSMPDYDIGNAQYIISFGADFLETFASPVRYGVAFGDMRRARATVRGLFTYAGPRMSMTAASADTWLPVKTGTGGMLALGMAGVLLDEGLYDRDVLTGYGIDLRRLEELMTAFPLTRIAQETGLPERTIYSTARDFAEFRPSVAIAGDTIAHQTNGIHALEAVHLLNLLAGNYGKQGGIFFSQKDLKQAAGSYSQLLDSIDAISGGSVSIALFHSVNPVYSTPKATGLEKALGRIPFIVSFSPFLDDTALLADIILPDHSDLESWADVIPSIGGESGVVGIMQPVVRPVYDTKAYPDLLLSLTKALKRNIPAELQFENYPEMLREHVRKTTGHGSSGFEQAWTEILQKGGVFPEERKPLREIKRSRMFTFTVPGKAVFAGDEKQFPFHLLIFPSPILFDGRSAHLPWLQETPDPMTTAVWGTWLEINPKSAASLGIRHGDLVEVESSAGSVRAPAVVYPAIRPDVVAMPLGQGHSGYGRYAEGRGANPLNLLEHIIHKENRLPAWGATRVRIQRISGKGGLVTAGHQEGSYRGELLEI
jgi:anaerobic selenocysteine-containing dehydrogenase